MVVVAVPCYISTACPGLGTLRKHAVSGSTKSVHVIYALGSCYIHQDWRVCPSQPVTVALVSIIVAMAIRNVLAQRSIHSDMLVDGGPSITAGLVELTSDRAVLTMWYCIDRLVSMANANRWDTVRFA